MKSKLKNITGFSLVELSVVLTVIGVTLSGALTLAIQKTEAEKVAETNKKMDAIEKALELYLMPYWGLSFVCPADGTLLKSSASYGVAGTASTGGCTGSNYISSNAYAGVVPIYTLMLPEDYMFDGWGRKFTFVMDYKLANNRWTNAACNVGAAPPTTVCFKYTQNGSIQINDSTGTAITNTAVYVLISHGKNGNGAWKRDVGSRLAPSSDTDEKSNAGDDSVGGFDNIFVQKSSTSTFDDIVRYKTKSSIISSVNAVTDTTVCSAANNENYSIGTLTCTGAANTHCHDLAYYIDIMCADM